MCSHIIRISTYTTVLLVSNVKECLHRRKKIRGTIYFVYANVRIVCIWIVIAMVGFQALSCGYTYLWKYMEFSNSLNGSPAKNDFTDMTHDSNSSLLPSVKIYENIREKIIM